MTDHVTSRVSSLMDVGLLTVSFLPPLPPFCPSFYVTYIPPTLAPEVRCVHRDGECPTLDPVQRVVGRGRKGRFSSHYDHGGTHYTVLVFTFTKSRRVCRFGVVHN